MLTDLGYAKRQILFARASNGRHQTSAVDDALARALDAIGRMAEEATAMEACFERQQIEEATYQKACRESGEGFAAARKAIDRALYGE